MDTDVWLAVIGVVAIGLLILGVVVTVAVIKLSWYVRTGGRACALEPEQVGMGRRDQTS